MISESRIIFNDGSDRATLYPNLTGEILLASNRDSEQQNQGLALKRPTDLTQADLSGSWFLVSMITPRDLSTNIGDGRLSDVFFRADHSLVTGEVSMDGGGNFSGLFSGTITGTPNGDLTVASDGNTISAQTNASKNVVLATVGDEEEQEVVVLVRKAEELALADLAGTWRISSIRVPSSLTESFYNELTDESRQADSSGSAQAGEALVDLFHSGSFGLNRLQVAVDPTGGVSGTVTGNFTLNGDRSVSFSDPSPGEPSVTFFPNADKTFMVGSVNDDDENELIYCLKISDSIPASPAAAADLQSIPEEGKLVLSWNSTSGLQLEESPTLANWKEVDGTSGQDFYEVDPLQASSRFFRLSERPEDHGD